MHLIIKIERRAMERDHPRSWISLSIPALVLLIIDGVNHGTAIACCQLHHFRCIHASIIPYEYITP